MNVIAVHPVNQVGIAQVFRIVDDSCRSNVITLRFHVFSNAVGRDHLPSIISQEAHEVFEKRNVANLVPHDDIFQQYRMVHIQLILMRILFIEAHLQQARKTTKLDIFSERIVRV